MQHIIRLSLIVIAWLIFNPQYSRGQVSAADSLALVALYDATGGDSWLNNGGWKTGSVGAWYGVTIFGGRVVRVELPSNNLIGPIPKEIGNLTAVVRLWLYNNQLTGSLPTELSSLTALRELFLFGNELSGSVPASLGSLTALEDLRLGQNQLSGNIPPELANLSALRILLLDNNNFFGSIPAELGNFGALQQLDLSGNDLSGTIPPSLSNLLSIQSLWLNENNLTGTIPGQLGWLTNLNLLSLARNQLTGEIPATFSGLSLLTSLYLEENKLGGELPEALGAITNLQNLNLSDNDFIGILPDTLATLNNLRLLALRNNLKLGGAIPANLVFVPLTDFLINSTNICEPETIEFQDWLSTITTYAPSGISCGNRQTDSLALVAIYNAMDGPNWKDNSNWLSGATLDSWRGIGLINGRVAIISLPQNNLSGSIPSDISNIKFLNILNMPGNQVTGTISADVLNLYYLEQLNLQSNNLGGDLPTALFDRPSLKSIDLGQNNLTGSLKPAIQQLVNLEYLAMNDNQIAGSLPWEIGKIPNLQSLYLQNNLLSGAVPQWVEELALLSAFNISGNDLTDLNNQSVLSSLTNFLVFNNRFQFDDLEPNMILFKDSTQFMPQKPLSEPLVRYVNKGDSLGIAHPVGGSANHYQWYYNGNPLPGETLDTIVFPNMDSTLNGDYKLEVVSDLVPGGKLSSAITHITTNPPSADWRALRAMYDSLDGDNWTIRTNWLSGAPLSYWYGIEATGDKVTRLALTDNNLNGSLPPDIKNLSDLKSLHLANNPALTGTLPAEIGQLDNLDSLDISDTGLSGEIPAELYQLSKLTFLSLANANITGSISPDISNLVTLKSLDLSGTEISGTIPDEFWTMTSLVNIRLGGRNLSGEIPVEIGQFTNLVELNISSTQISGELPKEIGKLSSLGKLILNNNRFFGSVPTEINNLRNLLQLEIEGNDFDFLPELTLSNLTILNISNNRFTYSDILPNQLIITDNTSQKPFADSLVLIAYTFEPLRLDPGIESLDGQGYQWYRDGELLPDGTDYFYLFTNFMSSDAGTYTVEVSHPNVANFNLIRSPLVVVVNEGDPPRPKAVEVISPNGDGVNDEMTIKNIELYPHHRVLIYDVLGRLVFETTDYDNINNPFIGRGNVNGYKELPAGTYYYMIDVGDTKKNGTGFFVMKKR